MICPKCGAGISDTGTICAYCGSAVTPPPPQPPQGVSAGVSDKKWENTMILSIFLGWAGVDRFYTGSILYGLVKLFTGGGLTVLVFLDIILLAIGSYRDGGGNKVKPPKIEGAPQNGTDWTTVFLFSVFLGIFGLDRMVSGRIGLGLLKLITAGGCGLWYVLDIVSLIYGTYRDGRGDLLVRE